MNLPALAIEKRAVTVFVTLLVVVAGLFCYLQLGQLEDPEFTVKTAAIITPYPGASPEQVELEVTDRIETKLQEMTEIKNIYSSSRPGLSIVKVDIKEQYWADKLPQIWDVVRKKVRDVEGTLPPGAGRPEIGDDYGYVFGFLLAVTSDGYTEAELERLRQGPAEGVEPGAGRRPGGLVGRPRQADLHRRLREPAFAVGIDRRGTDLDARRRRTSWSTPAAWITRACVCGSRRPASSSRPRPSPNWRSPASACPSRAAARGATRSSASRTSPRCSFGYADPPTNLLRQNGRMAIAMAIAPGSGVNVVDVGRAIDARLAELAADLPVGIGLERISWQSDSVSESIRSFIVNLLEAIVIVFLVLAATMGFRVGVIIGVSGLLFPILGSFIIMWLMKIDLQRVSLGALIVAMGMMVDNAIVVIDGFVVRLGQGMDRKKAAIEASSQPAFALLGATVVACMAFYPIFASQYSTGEYAGSLFTVVAISLMLSWVFSQTITPVLGLAWLPSPEAGRDGGRSLRDPVLPAVPRPARLGDPPACRLHGRAGRAAGAVGLRFQVRAATLLSRLQPAAGHDRLLGARGHAHRAGLGRSRRRSRRS